MTNNQALSVTAALLVATVFAIADDEATVEYLPVDTGIRVPLHTVVPQYPEKARRNRVEGEVEVCFNVSREGKTKRVAVRRSTNRVFEKVSRDAIRQSSYKPLAENQELSGIKTCRTFQFYLRSVAIETPHD